MISWKMFKKSGDVFVAHATDLGSEFNNKTVDENQVLVVSGRNGVAAPYKFIKHGHFGDGIGVTTFYNEFLNRTLVVIND